MTHTSTNSHAGLIAEIARLREAAREAEKSLERFAECNLSDGNCASLELATRRIQNIAIPALTRLRESLKGAGDER